MCGTETFNTENHGGDDEEELCMLIYATEVKAENPRFS